MQSAVLELLEQSQTSFFCVKGLDVKVCASFSSQFYEVAFHHFHTADIDSLPEVVGAADPLDGQADVLSVLHAVLEPYLNGI